MRVLVLHWGKLGAGPQIALSVAQQLRALGHEPLLSYSRESDIVTSLDSFGTAEYSLRTYGNARQAITALPRALRAAWRIRKSAQAGKFDGVYATMPSLWQPLVALMLAGTDTPYLASAHDIGRHSGEESRVLAALERFELTNASGIVLYSRASLEAASSVRWMACKPRWVVSLGSSIPAASTAERARTRSLRAEPTVGMFGRIERYKGTEVGVESVKELRRRGYEVRVEVWGSGDREIIERLPRTDWCGVHDGWVHDDDVAGILDRFDIALFPYIDASQSGVLPTVARLGIPCVVTPRGALPEAVHELDCGVVAGDVTPTAVADAIEELLSAARYEAQSRSALERSQAGGDPWQQTAATVAAALATLKSKGVD